MHEEEQIINQANNSSSEESNSNNIENNAIDSNNLKVGSQFRSSSMRFREGQVLSLNDLIKISRDNNYIIRNNIFQIVDHASKHDLSCPKTVSARHEDRKDGLDNKLSANS